MFLTASNVYLSDILETPSYFVLPPKIVLDLNKDRIDASIYWNLHGNTKATVTIFLFLQMVPGIGILWFVLVFPSNTIICMIV